MKTCSILLSSLLVLFLAAGGARAASFCSEALVDAPVEGLLETGLNSEQIRLLRTHSKGIISFSQWEESASAHEGVLLGIFGEDNRYENLVAKWGMTSWERAYRRFGIELGESRHTEKFLETLTGLEEPIVFLVPSGLWIHAMGVITKREMWWLLSNPERMNNVLFVIDLPQSSQ